jgi:alanyl-tRNA synthetase
MFYDLTEEGLGDISPEEFNTADDRQDIVEIWNDVFMEYEKKDGKVIGKLAQKNVDTGSGFERVAAVLQGVRSPYETDIFTLILKVIDEGASFPPNLSLPNDQEAPLSTTKSSFEMSKRIIADHIRASVFLVADGIQPANKDQGYILRRLIRRSIVESKKIGLTSLKTTVVAVIESHKEGHPNLLEKQQYIESIMNEEEQKFRTQLPKGERLLEKMVKDGKLSGADAFLLFSTHGFPFEISQQLAKEEGFKIDNVGFYKELENHQETSRTASAGKFKGGLAGAGEMETKYHTATHLLNAALRDVLGDHVEQKGSNITAERLRFDFAHPEKLTDEQKQKVTQLVNSWIGAELSVTHEKMTLEEAREHGAIGVFGDRYGKTITVYSIGSDNNCVSKEICGGPHVENTGSLGTFSIKKEEANSAGVRRIKAILV